MACPQLRQTRLTPTYSRLSKVKDSRRQLPPRCRSGFGGSGQKKPVLPVPCSTIQFTINHNELMKRLPVLGAFLICVSFAASCSRKPVQAPANAPEVLVTTVAPQDVPRVLERVATLDGFINANINAQVQGYIVSRDYQEGSLVKKDDLPFQIDARP